MRSAAFRAIHDIAVAAGSTLDYRSVGDLVVLHTRRLLGVDAASIRCWNSDLAGLELLALSDERPRDIMPTLPKQRGGSNRAFELREPVVVDDYTHWADGLPDLVANGVKSSVSVPMLVAGRAVGVLGAHTYESRRFTPSEVELMSLLAAQVGPALEAARLLAESQRRQREAEALAELARRGASESSTSVVAGLVVTEACRLLEADYAALALLEVDSLRVAAVWGNRLDGWCTIQRATPAGPMHRSIGSGETIVIERLDDDPAYALAELPLLSGEGTRTALATPLLGQEQPVGSLLVAWRTEVTVSKRHIGLAQALAGYAATIVANVRAREELAASERELRASEERRRAIVETASEGIIGLDPNANIFFTNDQACEMLGYTAGELAGRPLLEIVDEENRADFRQHMRRRRSGVKEQYDQHFRRKDGSDLWTITSGSPFFDETGAYLGTFGLLTNVTDRRKTEERLRLLELAVENAVEGIVIVNRIDHPASVVYASAGFCRMAAASKEEVVGHPLQFSTGPETDVAVFEDFLAEFSAGRPCHAEFVSYRRDGSSYVQECHLEGVLDSAGRQSHMIGIFRDVTERRRAQESLAHRATHDALTDLPNRAALEERLDQALALAQRDGKPAALLFIDLDRFKDVNDRYGHECGDLLLREIGPRLRTVLRKSDTVARLGGDEFAVVLPASSECQTAIEASRKIRAALAEPFEIAGRHLRIDASIGVALYPDHGQDGASLMRYADAAMYTAKRQGAGRR